MKKCFLLQDIINLEYFLHLDKGTSPASLHKRDREIFLSQGEKAGGDARSAIRLWLASRMRQEFFDSDLRSPGEIFADILRITNAIAIAAGIIVGAGTGLAFFSYSGTTPVNVFQFLLLFIAPQLFLISLLLVSRFIQKIFPVIRIPSFYTLFTGRGLQLLLRKTQNRWFKGITAEQRGSIAHALNIAKIYNNRYGSLFYWPIFCIFQRFGLFFNLALLAVTLLKITTSDLAFGWQSTIQMTDITVFQLVKTFALPWSWLAGEAGFPALTEIAGSRIILKDGIYHLTTANLTSWWPFLVLCLLFYGVFTRILFLLVGRWMSFWKQKNIAVDMPQYRALLQRMRNPLVTTQAQDHPLFGKTETARPCKWQKRKEPPPENSPCPQLILVGIDIYEQLVNPQQQLAEELKKLQFEARDIVPFQCSYEQDQLLLDKLAKIPDDQGIFLLLEGWMVPLVSLLGYLGGIRTRIPLTKSITIALTGRPQQHPFVPVKEHDFALWQQKIASLADPYIHLIPLRGVEP